MNNIIITGIPRSGKSTLLAKIISNFRDKVGFITKELLVDCERVGFEIETSIGEKVTLAHINLKSDIQVAKYFVDINALNSVLHTISKFSSNDLLYIDEVGQMQLYSDSFKFLVQSYLDSENFFVSTLSAVYNDEFTESIRKRNDVIILEVTESTREGIYTDVAKLVKTKSR